jgi:hypothetical protein
MLGAIMESKQCPVDPATLQGPINCILKSDRLLAMISIQEAASGGLNPRKVAEDLERVARGDEEAAAGHYANAIEHYRNAWRHAIQLRLQVSQERYAAPGQWEPIPFFQAVYHLLNADPAVVCERTFVPDKDDLAHLSRTGEELVSYESQSPLHTFDVLGLASNLKGALHLDTGTQAEGEGIWLPKHGERASVVHASIQ